VNVAPAKQVLMAELVVDCGRDLIERAVMCGVAGVCDATLGTPMNAAEAAAIKRNTTTSAGVRA